MKKKKSNKFLGNT